MIIPTTTIASDLHASFFGLAPHRFAFSHSLALHLTPVNVAKIREYHRLFRVAKRTLNLVGRR
ncbi:MAG: hypothetical protein M3R24_30750 [Chloroflexota bacterium]|nr:hypothetical protein [Chloroflexota bacterium]